MSLKDFEDTLKNIERDQMLMSYGDNRTTVSSILTIVSLVQTLENVIKSDRINDMFVYALSGKVMELGSIIEMQGRQRLMERGINAPGGMAMPFGPVNQNATMYNQPMSYPNMMYNPMMQMGPMPQMQQQYPQMQQMQAPQMQQQPMQMPQQSMPQVQQMQQAPAPAAPAPVAAPPSAAQAPKSAAPKAAASFSLPGLDGGAPDGNAVGRDYLLKLLEEK